MGCSDWGRQQEESSYEIERLRKRLDHVTDLLCRTCRSLTDEQIKVLGSDLEK
jgi:hypothetical protein